MKNVTRTFAVFTALILIFAASLSMPGTSHARNSEVDLIVQQLNQLVETANVEGQVTLPRVGALPESLKSRMPKQPSVRPFIIGGNDAARREYTEYALVLITDGSNIIGACGGTMIAPNKVLTAAHCAQFPASRYFVVPSFYNFRDRFTQRNLFQGARIADHPNYRDENFDYDVAVITLGRSTSTNVAKVHSGSNQFSNTVGMVIGTGLTGTNPNRSSNILQEVSAPITSNSKCNDVYEEFVGVRPITKRMMCAGFATNGRGSCSGDSGGPLFADIDGERVIVGTVSFGFLPCESNRATQGYARVATMESFIRSQSPQTQFVQSNGFSSIAPIILLMDDE